MSTCASCRAGNRAGATFCASCGSPMERMCPNRHPVGAEARFRANVLVDEARLRFDRLDAGPWLERVATTAATASTSQVSG